MDIRLCLTLFSLCKVLPDGRLPAGRVGYTAMLMCSCVIYASPFLLSTDNSSSPHRRVVQPGVNLQPSHRGCCRLAQVYFRFAVRPAAQREVHIQPRYRCFALLLATNYRSRRHRRVVRQGFGGKCSDRCRCAAASVRFSALLFALPLNARVIYKGAIY